MVEVPEGLARAVRGWFRAAVLESGDEHSALHAIASAARPGTGVWRTAGGPMVTFSEKERTTTADDLSPEVDLEHVIRRMLHAGVGPDAILEGVKRLLAADEPADRDGEQEPAELSDREAGELKRLGLQAEVVRRAASCRSVDDYARLMSRFGGRS